MDKKEQLKKALWAYGNYDLKVMFSANLPNRGMHNMVGLVKGLFCDRLKGCRISVEYEIEDGKAEIYDPLSYFTPLLLPLSSLTEEIEHPVTGEKFVPLDELRKERWGKQLTWFGDDKRSFPEAYNSIDGLMIETDDYSIDIEISEVDFIKERLIEWHFNVFDLPQEMWVDKRTIKQ